MSNGIYIDTPEDRYKSENSKLISVKQVSEFVNKFMNGVSSTPSIHDTCLYTVSLLTYYKLLQGYILILHARIRKF